MTERGMDERSLCFGPGAMLVGTICTPSTPVSHGGVGIILFNAGVVHRVGPHRINVRLARKLADIGIASLRFDLSGQGDSARATGNIGYDQQATADLQAAMDLFTKETGISQFALFGFCSGGYQGYATCLNDKRVAGLLMYDAYIYPTIKSRLNRYMMRIRHRGFIAAVGGWAARAGSRSWARIGAERGGTDTGTRPAETVTTGDLPSPAEFARGINQLLSRKVRVGLMYAGGSLDHYNYPNQFADIFQRFGIAGRVSVEFFPKLDHAGTILSQQAELIGRIVLWMAALNNDQSGTARHVHVSASTSTDQ